MANLYKNVSHLLHENLSNVYNESHLIICSTASYCLLSIDPKCILETSFQTVHEGQRPFCAVVFYLLWHQMEH